MKSNLIFLLQKIMYTNLGSHSPSLEWIFYWEMGFMWYYFHCMKQWGIFHYNVRHKAVKCASPVINSFTYVLRGTRCVNSGEGSLCADFRSFLWIFSLHFIINKNLFWEWHFHGIENLDNGFLDVMPCNLIHKYQYYGRKYLPFYTVSHPSRM